MFESAELDHTLSKAVFAKEADAVRADLLDLQYDVLAAARFPVVVLLNGLAGAGRGETANMLNAWMDSRHIQTHAFPDPTCEERQRPPMWRFWQALPPKGKTGLLLNNWYADPITGSAERKLGQAALTARIDDILRFEKMLADEGVLIIKFWLHLSRRHQKQRFEALQKDRDTRWRVTPHDWKLHDHYKRYVEAADRVLRETSVPHAPWTVIDGSDANYRTLEVARHLRDALRQRMTQKEERRTKSTVAPPANDNRALIRSLQLRQPMAEGEYEHELEKWQGRLNGLARRKRFRKHSLIVVFEGNDAAGKGSAIRRITAALDARWYRTVAISAPSEEERAYPYLWRFWRHVPPHGRILIMDRSWYGRVLVERVEGYCGEADWMRAYGEINDFEHQLVASDTVIVKFWLAVSKREQLKRFHEREQTRFKRFKITPDDWRNRDKWDAYEQAACDMVDRTSTAIAPWTLVEADNKHYARIKVLKTICERLEAELKKGD